MLVDWVICITPESRVVFSRAATAELARKAGMSPLVNVTAHTRTAPPRWAVLDNPEAFEISSGGIQEWLTHLSSTIGPVGLVCGDSIGADARTWTHPTLGRIRVKAEQFGFEQSALSQAQVERLADELGWRSEPKNSWWVFTRRPTARVAEPWQAVAYSLAVALGRDTSMSDLEGWNASLGLRLREVRARSVAVQTSRALLSTIESLLDQGAIQLAEGRLEAYERAGGSEATAGPYRVLVGWMKRDWPAVNAVASSRSFPLNPALAWRIAWAQFELGQPQAAEQTLSRFPNLPPTASRVGAWYRATMALVEASQGRLARPIRLLAELPPDAVLEPTRSRIAAAIEKALQTAAAGDPSRVERDLGEVLHWKEADLPPEVQKAIAPWLRARPPESARLETVAPEDAFARWEAAQGLATTDPQQSRLEAEGLLATELKGRTSPVRMSRLLTAIIPLRQDWRPSERLLANLALLERNAALLPAAQGAVARALLLAGDRARAVEFAKQVVQSADAIPILDLQAAAEVLSPDPAQSDGAARTAWINLLATPPRWKVRPRLAGGADLVRSDVVRGLAEHLYLSNEYSRLIALMFNELEPLERWSDLWVARREAMLLVDALAETGDRGTAFEVLSQLLPVAIAAHDPAFIGEEILRRCESSSSVGPLETGEWQVVLERLLPNLQRLGSEELRKRMENQALLVLGRARWATDDVDFSPGLLVEAMQAAGLGIPPELIPSRPELGPTEAAHAPELAVRSSVLIVGGYDEVQLRAAEALRASGVKVRLLSPGFDENVDEKRVREALQGVGRVVVVWKCILHKVTIVLDQLLSRPEFKQVEKTYARGKGHSSVVAAALGSA